MSDRQILELLYEDSNRAMELLYDQYIGLLYYIVKHKIGEVGTNEDVEECVSNILYQFYEQRTRVDLSKGTIKAYLCVMANRMAIDTYRKLMRVACQQYNTEESIEPKLEGEIGNDMINSVIVKEERMQLYEHINRLREPDREIMLRKYYLGQKTKEIAEVLHLKENTVDQRVSRTLRKLRILLGGVNDERKCE